MHKYITATATLLLAFALAGGAVSALPAIDLDATDAAIPTGGLSGQAIGCDLTKDGYVYGYGKAGVPSSSGYPDNTCGYNGREHSGDIAYTVLKGSTGRSTASAFGYDSSTWQFASLSVSCSEPATVLVDWTGDEPAATYLTGGDCNLYRSSGDISELPWSAYGNGYDTVKFVHTDNLADALVHLLA